MKKFNKVITVAGLIGVAVLGTGCGKAAETVAADSTTLQNSAAANSAETIVQEAGSEEVQQIKVAHNQAYIPYSYVNDAGEADGFEVQVLKEVDALLPQYEFTYEATTDDDLIIGVESGKYDIGVKGAWYTEERSKKFVFPEHYLGASSIGIVYRTENADQITDLESFAAYSGKLVPIAPQNAQYNIVEQYNTTHPDNKIDLQASDAFTVSDAYVWVVEGRYDAYFDIKTTFENNIVAEDGAYHDYADKLSYAVYQAIPTYPLINKNDQALADAYDQAIEELTENGTILELEQKYFGEDLFQYIAE